MRNEYKCMGFRFSVSVEYFLRTAKDRIFPFRVNDYQKELQNSPQAWKLNFRAENLYRRGI